MKNSTEYHYATYGDILITVLSEKGDPPVYKLVQNGVLINEQNGDSKSVSLIGNSGIRVEVTIKKSFFGLSYKLVINNNPLKLIKVAEEQAIKMMEEKRRAQLKEVEEFDKTNQKIYPIFKPGDWPAKKVAVYNVLLGEEPNPMLLIGYGYSLEKSFSFLTIKDLEKNTLENIHAEAMKNIATYEVKVEESEIHGQPALFASGSDFSSEKLLDKAFILQAQQQLNASEILVSIPRRTCMMMMNKNVSDEVVNQFVFFHMATWNDGSYGNAPIYNGLFVVKDGRIASVAPLG